MSSIDPDKGERAIQTVAAAEIGGHDEQNSQNTFNPPNPDDEPGKFEDFSRTDTTVQSASQASILSHFMGWHPFMRFYCRVADMANGQISDSGQRMHDFAQKHKILFWICIFLDGVIILASIVIFFMLAIHALWPIMSPPFMRCNV